jgi:UDP-3-O-[3-hydroxymyristoyl] N-acetylglucosamine deacetylase
MVFGCADFFVGRAGALLQAQQIQIVIAHVEGVTLFSGERSSVEIKRCEGPSTLHTDKRGGPISEWSRVAAFRTTALAHPSGARVSCVEHLFAALAAHRAHDGVAISVHGNELPILDGASAEWCALLRDLDVRESPPKLKIAREGEVLLGDSKYLFFSGDQRSEVSVEIDLSKAGSFAASLVTRAHWHGSRADFISRIAPARTFILARDLAEFEASGAGANISADSFLVIGEANAIAHGAPFSSDEPARHKLLDLIGDFFLAGGPPLGRVEVASPGHAKNHEAIAIALNQGILIQ